MRCAKLMLLGLSLVAAVAVTAGPAVPDAEVERWTAVLATPGVSAKERQAALTALKAAAAGGPEDPATRDATFALADYWLGVNGPGAIDKASARMLSADLLWPDDPRVSRMLLHLTLAQLENGDSFGAHLSFKKLIDPPDADPRPEIVARAAANAMDASDAASALKWSRRVDPDGLPPSLAALVHLTRLEAGQALGRLEVALESVKTLAEKHPDALRHDPMPLLAAGRTCEAVGLLREAIGHYLTFVNLYTDLPEYPQVLLGIGELHERMGELTLAESMFDLLIEFDPASAAAHQARLELLELDDSPASAEQASGYVAVLREARDLSTVQASCERFAGRFIGSGLPEELLSALADLAEESGDSLAPLGARKCLADTLESVLALLDSRDDYVAVAACAGRARSLGIPLPASQRGAVDKARQRLGLQPPVFGLAGETVRHARRKMAAGDWSAAASTLRMVVATAGADRSVVTEAMRLRAEALWRGDLETEALAQIDQALEASPDSEHAREMRVLRADILFASGRIEDACADYRTAAELRDTRWVTLQMERCSGDSAPESPDGETS